MRFNRVFVGLLVLLSFALAGCFQQAGESFQPAGTTAEPITIPDANSTAIPSPVLDATVTVDNGGELPTADSSSAGSGETVTPGIAITILSPTRPPLATSTLETDASASGSSDGSPSATAAQFVTPSSPLGPVTPDTPVPMITTPTSTPSGLITPTALPGADSSDGCTHVIQPGDTLYRIAVKAGITVAELQNANPNVNGDIIQPGDILNIPGCSASSESSVSPTDVPAAEAPVVPPAGGTTYTVERGDTLFAIAQRFGVTVQAIQDANNLSNPNQLSLGQQLIIPPKTG